MVSSVVHNTLQVEHTKKCNSIDSKNKFVKWNASHRNCLTVCFYVLLKYYYAIRKWLLLEQSALAQSADWPSMHDCLNRLEESSNFSAGVVQANFANKTISIAGRGLESQMLWVSLHYSLPVMANSTSLVFLLYFPLSAWSDVHN